MQHNKSKQKNKGKHKNTKQSNITYPFSKYNFRETKHGIVDAIDEDILSLVIFNQQDLDHITSICKPIALDSEFQVHYRALMMRIKNNTQEFILTIPTVYYNFTQEVSGSSVDYHLSDIDKVAASVKDISIAKAKQILENPIFTAIKSLGYEVCIYESNCGSCHRHPGRFGFSNIDLTKDPKDPGVVYRNKNASNFVQSDSIIYISSSGNTELFTTETRVVDIDTDEKDFTSGTYTEVPTVSAVAMSSTIHQRFTSLLGTGVSSTALNYQFIGDVKHTRYMLVQELLKMYQELELSADISYIKEDNITQSHHFSKYQVKHSSQKGITSKPLSLQSSYDIFDIDNAALLADPFYCQDYYNWL